MRTWIRTTIVAFAALIFSIAMGGNWLGWFVGLFAGRAILRLVLTVALGIILYALLYILFLVGLFWFPIY